MDQEKWDFMFFKQQEEKSMHTDRLMQLKDVYLVKIYFSKYNITSKLSKFMSIYY